MNTMAQASQALASHALASPALASPGPLACRVRLVPGPVAAAQARRQVQAAIAAWHVPVDADVAILLTSDLVTHAIRQTPGAVTLSVRCTSRQLRVDVQDSVRAVRDGAPSGAHPEPGLALVAALSAEWGRYQTPAGQAAYFTLEVQPAPR